VATFLTSIAAFGAAAPCGSVIVPVMVLSSPWPKAASANSSKHAIAPTQRLAVFAEPLVSLLIMEGPPKLLSESVAPIPKMGQYFVSARLWCKLSWAVAVDNTFWLIVSIKETYS
jgi:hypothetical protein